MSNKSLTMPLWGPYSKKYMGIWDCFCKHAFYNAPYFELLFFTAQDLIFPFIPRCGIPPCPCRM